MRISSGVELLREKRGHSSSHHDTRYELEPDINIIKVPEGATIIS